VALYRDVLSDEAAGIHRTAIPEGKKLGRKMLGRWRERSRAIKLWPLNGPRLFVGEGLETTLAAALHMTYQGAPMQPAWAMTSAGAIAHLPVIPDVEHLVILVDNDANHVGQQAAQACANVWQRADRKVSFCRP
jgi:hypothetical protein